MWRTLCAALPTKGCALHKLQGAIRSARTTTLSRAPLRDGPVCLPTLLPPTAAHLIAWTAGASLRTSVLASPLYAPLVTTLAT